jgi:hypothetical protein
MAGGLLPPEEDEAHCAFATGGVIFVLEDADLQVGKVGKVGRICCALMLCSGVAWWPNACLLIT